MPGRFGEPSIKLLFQIVELVAKVSGRSYYLGRFFLQQARYRGHLRLVQLCC